jgi:hypothetical protein
MANIISGKKAKNTDQPTVQSVGRGRPTVDSEAVTVRLVRDALTRLDDWRREQPDLPSRPEAIRRLLEQALPVATKGKRR